MKIVSPSESSSFMTLGLFDKSGRAVGFIQDKDSFSYADRHTSTFLRTFRSVLMERT